MGFFDSLLGLFGGGGKGGKGLKRIVVEKRFDLQARAGQGSMSKAWKAYDRDLGRTVCLKVLDKAKTAKFEENFKKQGLKKPSEGDICLGLNHRNIVKTFEHGLTEKSEPYLVMEWIEGKGFNYLVETRSKQLEGNRLNYLIQLCDGLEYLHKQKFLHRDICPRNAMVSNDGEVKLIDFGLAIPFTEAFCRPGNRTGTADYLAPEIIKRMKTDQRVDVFALGVTAFEIFTHDLPWERSTNSAESLRRHLNTPPRSPADLKPDLDPELVKIIMKAIAKDPAERIPTMSVFKQMLEGLEKQDE
jgi:serine/threonine protein kinase